MLTQSRAISWRPNTSSDVVRGFPEVSMNIKLIHFLFESAHRYSRYVSRSVLKIDTLLKVLMTPEDPPEEFVKHYLLLIPCQSFSDFQKVLDLKVRARLALHLLTQIADLLTSSLRAFVESSRTLFSTSSWLVPLQQRVSPTIPSSRHLTWTLRVPLPTRPTLQPRQGSVRL